MTTKEEMEKIIFEIGDLIHVRYKGFFKRVPLTAQEIIKSHEFKMEFEKPFPNLSQYILDNFKKVNLK